MSLELQRYGDFSLSIHNKTAGQRVPLLGAIEVSRRCPLNCSHCYNNLPMNDLETARQELTYEEHCRILDELADMGLMWLLYTGGEIFARRDFLDIYKYAKRKGIFVTLFTNGNLVTEKIADTLVDFRPFAIEITLYGRTRETYEALTRVPGSYDRCLRGIRILKERGLPLALKTVAVTVNKHEIWDMKRFVQEELGLSFKLDPMITPRIDCSSSPLGVRLTPEEIVAIDLGDPDREKEWARFSSAFTGPAHPPGKEDEVYHCGGGINSFAIDPLGKMTICVLSHMDSYDLRKGSVREGWDHFLGKVRQKRAKRVTKCTVCQIKAMCGMCPATAELETGDPELPVDFLCHTAHLRALTMGLSVPEHGECEYCQGGSAFQLVREEANRLASGLPAPSKPAPVFLPVLSPSTSTGSTLPAASGCSSGGCGSF